VANGWEPFEGRDLGQRGGDRTSACGSSSGIAPLRKKAAPLRAPPSVSDGLSDVPAYDLPSVRQLAPEKGGGKL
jgi:hypothetical protein